MDKHKRLTYPTWRYKSRLTYAQTKLRQWNKMIAAINKFHSGSAWLPPSARNLIDPVKQDAADRAMEQFIKRVKKEAKNG